MPYPQMTKVFEKDVLWYVGGLKFECLRCGRCCSGPEEGYIWVTKREISAIARYLRMDEGSFNGRYVLEISGQNKQIQRKNNGDCAFLKDKQYRIYPIRPEQCCTWPFWVSNLKNPEDWSHAAQLCPGINRGPLSLHDEIQRKAHSESGRSLSRRNSAPFIPL